MDIKLENIVDKGQLLVLSNFFFCHYVFKQPSAAAESESIYMRERVKKMLKNTKYSKYADVFL